MTTGISGPNFPTTVTDDATVGNKAWTNVTRVEATDASYATATTSTSGDQTHYINCQGFGFNVPATATIAGVQCKVVWHGSSTVTNGEDASVKLIKGGTIQGNNAVFINDLPPTSDATFFYPLYGWTTYLWGLTLTPSDVNASNFGVAFSAQALQAGSCTYSVDSITLTVYWYYNATSALFPGTAADVAPGGDVAYTSVNNIKATDGSFATCSFSASGTSDYLEATNFGFAVPSNATINGVGVTWTNKNGGPDVLVSLIKGGTIQGNNNSYNTAQVFNGSSTTLIAIGYGGPSDLWGLTLTPSDVNASNFGAMFQGQNTSSKSSTLNTDSVTITVYYTVPAPSNVLYSFNGLPLAYQGSPLTLAI